jgi:phosphoesterase RecJ-like protein
MSAIISKTSCPSIMPTEAINRIIDKAKCMLVVSHIDPDGDAIGTQLAFGEFLKRRGKDVLMVRDSEIPDKYHFLPKVDDIVEAGTLAADCRIDAALVLECPNVQRAGTVSRLLTAGVAVINIDHHRDNAMFGDVNWVDIQPSSVGEMAFEYMRQTGDAITPTIAECLYTAILTDTGRFRFSSTSPRTMVIAGELLALGADSRKICDQVYYNVRPAALKLMGKVVNGIEYHLDGKVAILTLTKQMLVDSGANESDSDGLVDLTLFGRGVVAGALLKELDATHTKASLRSANGVNVAAIANNFGGGGHYNAAGCTIPMALKDAKQKVIALLAEANDGLA